MKSNSKHSGPYFIVEVDSFDGEQSSIAVRDEAGHQLRAIYCIARKSSETGVLQFVDYRYLSIAEARAAWPEAQ